MSYFEFITCPLLLLQLSIILSLHLTSHCLNYSNFKISRDMSYGKFSLSLIFLRVILALLEFIIFHMNFRFNSSSSINLCAIFVEIALNS